MGRETDGTYNLPLGSPSNLQPGTTIQSSWANTTLNDIATSLTNSLSRDGKGGMRAPFEFADGLEATPSITWSQEQNTGFYRPGPVGDMRLSVLGSDLMRWNNTAVEIWANGTWNTVLYEGSGGAGLPDGITDYQSLVWDESGQSWVANSQLLINYTTGDVTVVGDIALGGDVVMVSGATVDGVDVSALGINFTAHTGDATIHFTEASINHTAIQNVGVNTHVEIDSHMENTNIHFEDVPVNGLQYARKDQAWVEVAATGGSVPNGTVEGQTLRWETTGALWEVSNDLVIGNTGDVGIGDVTPNRKFHVSDSASEVARIQSTSGSAYVELNNSGASTVKIGSTAAAFEVSIGSVKSTQNATGLGLGTATPASVLDVNGSIYTEGAPFLAGAGGTPTTPKRFVVIDTLPGTTDINTIYFVTG